MSAAVGEPAENMEQLKIETTEEVPQNSAGADDGDVITPWEVSSTSAAGVDYDKLISKFIFTDFHSRK